MDEKTNEDINKETSSRQEEARRIFEAIRQKKEPAANEEHADTEKVFPRLPSEDAAELETLISNTILAKTPPPPEEEELPDLPEIDPISTQQIKVMRKFAASKVAAKEPVTKTIAESLIRGYFEIIAYFTPASRVQRCQKEGHLCINCGSRIPIAKVPTKNEEDDSGDAAAPTAKKRT